MSGSIIEKGPIGVGTTAERDLVFPSPIGNENWDNTTLGYRQWYNAASAQWEMAQQFTGGAAHVSVNTIAAGLMAGEKVVEGSATLAATASSIAETPDVHDCNTLVLKLTGLTGDTVSVSYILDQASLIATAAVLPIDLATGALAASSALGNGSYQFKDLVARFVRLTKSGGAETPVASYLARG